MITLDSWYQACVGLGFQNVKVLCAKYSTIGVLEGFALKIRDSRVLSLVWDGSSSSSSSSSSSASQDKEHREYKLPKEKTLDERMRAECVLPRDHYCVAIAVRPGPPQPMTSSLDYAVWF